MSRAEMQQYFGEVRAFFAPVDRAAEGGTVFDPSAAFDLEDPPAPWIDLGKVGNFQRSSRSKMEAMRTGAAGVVQAQFRKVVEARVSLDFCEWGKLQMALAASSEHMNVLESSGGMAKGSGGDAKAGVAVQSGSSATDILLDPQSLGAYAAGDLVVVDVDYVAGMTLLGTGITGGVAGSVALSADAVRRVSYNVARVASVDGTGLQLATPLTGGAPAAGAKVQKVVGFVDREGAGFFQEWSALFVLEGLNGGRVCFHYPRLQSAAGAEETVESVEAGVRAARLHAEFVAMAVTDGNDGQSVLCYRSLIPAEGTPSY